MQNFWIRHNEFRALLQTKRRTASAHPTSCSGAHPSVTSKASCLLGVIAQQVRRKLSAVSASRAGIQGASLVALLTTTGAKREQRTCTPDCTGEWLQGTA